ncbi:MAG TPA: phenylalanine--tRNA ligase subunit beta, partial [Blastocatellia bacterium]|nr:phenylalanine--tRNA ligase subunit beta [Blastocatellia bacterium]
LNLLHGRKIVVRRAAAGEQITTLDGFTRELAADQLIIADADHPVAIAGVMGGEETEISERTTDVLIESAYFNPASVRHTAKALGMDTEASYRFARGADFGAQVRAADRVAELVAEIAGGQILKGVIDVYPNPITRDPVTLRVSRVERLTGLKVSTQQALNILRSLEFEIVAGEEVQSNLRLLTDLEEITVIPPSFRVDIFREEDLIEEVARHTGYDLVDTTLPAWSGTGRYLAGEDQRRRIRRALTTIGFDEAYTFSFVNGERDALFRRGAGAPALLANPIDVNQNEMRASLITGLLESTQHNFNQGRRDVRLFEMGRVFEAKKNDARPDERELLGVVMSGAAQPDDWRGARPADFYDLAGAVEAVMGSLNVSGFTIERARVEYLHPGQSAVLIRDGEEVARYGRLHPRVAQVYKFRQPVYVAEIEFARLLELPADDVRYSALPRLPASSRDVSMLMPDAVMWAEIERAINELGIAEIVDLRVFDVYTGKGMPEGMRSLAFRVTYRSAGRTLTDEEISAMHERIRELMVNRFGAQLR